MAIDAVINQHINYRFDSNRGFDVPVIGAAEPLFGKSLDEPAAATLIDRGKMVIRSRAYGNRADGGGAPECGIAKNHIHLLLHDFS